ncbi:hypothetical protein C8R45DRAFT_1114130 [Mycena sanguinolenta]|nr:hypothetical protein C8R45DRAFT_1114130 [Mycena sanguinolenta]
MSIPPSSPSTTLLDLPNELILIIAQFSATDDDGLLHLAASCRRLNLLLVPLLFTRSDFTLPLLTPTGDVGPLKFTRKTLTALPALGIASFVTSISTLDVAFFASDLALHPQEIFAAAHAVNVLATRLQHLGSLRFNPYGGGEAAKELFSGWSVAVARVLNSAVGRADCSVTVYSGWKGNYVADPRPFEHVFPVAERDSDARRAQAGASALRRLLLPWRRLLPGSNTTLTSTLRLAPTPAPLPLPANPRISTFTILTPFLFHVTFLPWTTHLCNTAPLTSLSLMHINLSLYDWSLILPKLSMEALRELSICCQTLAMPDLVQFLRRHEGITVLDLRGCETLGAVMPPISAGTTTATPETFLPHLTILTASPEHLLYFLAPPDFFFPPAGSSNSSLSSAPGTPALRSIISYSVYSWDAKKGDDPSASYYAAQLAGVRACVAARGLSLQV